MTGRIPLCVRGSLLIEVLISMVLFSIGILGLVGVQAAALKNSAEAKYRADASYFVNQIIGQMWADNPANLASYAHNSTTTGTCNFGGSASSNANVVAWLGDAATPGTLAHSLPGYTTSRQQITIGGNNLVTVTVCWQSPTEDVPHSFVGVAQING